MRENLCRMSSRVTAMQYIAAKSASAWIRRANKHFFADTRFFLLNLWRCFYGFWFLIFLFIIVRDLQYFNLIFFFLNMKPLRPMRAHFCHLIFQLQVVWWPTLIVKFLTKQFWEPNWTFVKYSLINYPVPVLISWIWNQSLWLK